MGLCRGQIVVGISKKELGPSLQELGGAKVVGRELVLDQEPSPFAEMFLGCCPLNPAPCAGDAAALGSFLLELLHCCLSLINEVSSALG